MNRREFLKTTMGIASLGALRKRLEELTDQELMAISPLITEMATCPGPLDLARATWGDSLQTPAHLLLLNEKLKQLAGGEIGRLMVTMPPRHGKSMLVSEHFPAWFLGKFPDKRVILASYEADFAAQWGRKARTILNEHGERLFNIRISNTSSAANRWDIAGRRGGMQTAGVGGPITGKGAHLLLVDDPIKNSEEANSYVFREKTWQWWQSATYTRMEPDAACVLVQTRWHEDDLAGRILSEMKHGGEQWECIDFPAVAIEADALGRAQGEALWPERYNAEALQRIRKAVGEYFWACLYQQSPKSAVGNKIKRAWIRYFSMQGDYYVFQPNGKREVAHKSEFERFCVADCAASSEDVIHERKGRKASKSVISTFDFHRKTGRLVWVKVRAGYWEFDQLLAQALETIGTDKPAWFGAEDEKTGRALLQLMRSHRTKPLSHEGKDKLTRFAPALNQLEQGKVYLPEEAPWLLDAEQEILTWDGHPDSPFDYGDTLGYAAIHAFGKSKGAWGGVLPVK